MINYIDDCISNEISPVPVQEVTVPLDTAHPCSVRGVTDFSAKLKCSKDLHNIINAINILLCATNIGKKDRQENVVSVLENLAFTQKQSLTVILEN